MYGAGKPLDENAFVYADISGIRPVYPIVRVSDYVDARVSGITLTDEKTKLLTSAQLAKISTITLVQLQM